MARSRPAAAAPAKPGAEPSRAEPAILIDLGQGQPGIVLTVDPATKLLSSIDMKIDPELIAQAAKRARAADRAVRLDLRRDLDRGAQGSVVRLRGSQGIHQGRFAASSSKKKHATDRRVGKPAPDFTLTLLDGPGKTKTVTKAELAGKVVVIDFWATWCGPCMKELPEIQKLIDSYADTEERRRRRRPEPGRRTRRDLPQSASWSRRRWPTRRST